MKILDTVGTNLHSTIFILKPKTILRILDFLLYLHSTIFILKLSCIPSNYFFIFIFTFYYIYIKTECRLSYIFLDINLHSTIFILKLHTLLMLNHFLPHLHSTIFILKHHINLSQASLYN